METPYLRWVIVAYSVFLTLLTGALTTAQILNGAMVYDNPNAIGDGQYSMVFGVGGAAGVVVSLPAAILAGVWIARHPDFAPTLNKALLGLLVIGVGIGVLLAGLGAGVDGLGWAAIGMFLTSFGVVLLPLAVYFLIWTMPISAIVSAALLLAVGGAYWYYRHIQRHRPES
jgi:hypothetical protein